jgi:broad specificity phosphatase PhoE
MDFMKQTIYLIRHGHTSGTESNLLYGSTELPVTEDGLREIESYAEAGIYPDPDGAAVWTSGMYRTEQTLHRMYGEIEHRTEPRLKEIDLGIYEMKTVDEVMETEYGNAWLSGQIEEPSFEGGDSHEGFLNRINHGLWNLARLAEDEGQSTIIVVIHGAVITYIMNEAFPGVHRNRWLWCPNPGKGYKLEIEGGKALSWEPIGDIQVDIPILKEQIASE